MTDMTTATTQPKPGEPGQDFKAERDRLISANDKALEEYTTGLVCPPPVRTYRRKLMHRGQIRKRVKHFDSIADQQVMTEAGLPFWQWRKRREVLVQARIARAVADFGREVLTCHGVSLDRTERP